MASSKQWARAEGDARIQQFVVSGDYYAGAGRGHVPPPRALPDAPEALVGRERELGELLAVLEPGSGQRAVVVAGLAGVGKSALAVTAAEQAMERGWFTGGVLFLSLRGYDPAGAVGAGQAVGTLLEGLGVADAELPAGPDGRLARYRSELAARAGDGRHVLVVADDAGDAAQVRDLVPPGGDAHRLLVTSRDRLVAPDFTARVLDLEVLGADAAAELVADALRRVRPEDPRPGAEPRALAEVAGHCGRLPLALSVAAAVLAGDPGLRAAELARQLADARTRLEALSPRDRAGIPTGVRAAFGLSYARLPAEQARLLRLLTALPGPDCALRTIAFALRGADVRRDWKAEGAAVRALLAALARAGLVAEQPTGSDRWRMHDLVRLYAAERAEENAGEDNREEIVDRALQVYSVMLHGAHGHLLPKKAGPEARWFPDLRTALWWLDEERANLVQVVPSYAALGRAEDAIGFSVALCAYLFRRRLFEDLIVTCRIAAEEARRIGDEVSERIFTGEVGTALAETSRLEEANVLHEQLLASYGEEDNGIGKAMTLANLACVSRARGELEEALAAGEQALSLFRALDARGEEGEALAVVGVVLAEQGRTEEGVAMLEQAVAVLEEHGDPLRTARATAHLAGALQEAGRPGEAISEYQKALLVFASMGDWHQQSTVALHLGMLLSWQGRSPEALMVLGEGASAAERAGERDKEGFMRVRVGDGLLSLSAVADAVEEFEAALRLREHATDSGWPAEALHGLGLAYGRQGDFVRSAAAHLEAAALFREAGWETSAARAQKAYEAARRRGRRWWRRLRTRLRR
ncbi:tetratricopeptide repeat protein [Streptomyces sp. NPDC058734]|uniref:tetratricopeptide repeat protein n=1 Tax=Streptomyces sp. NPDC058734 TaxID=3346615 RepID=UPI0036B4B01E